MHELASSNFPWERLGSVNVPIALPGTQFTTREMDVWEYVMVCCRAKIGAGSSICWTKAQNLWAKTVKVATLQDENLQPQMRIPVYIRTEKQLKEKNRTMR
jgi:hypothetical protein